MSDPFANIITIQKAGVAAINQLVAFITPAQLMFRGAATVSPSILYTAPTNATRAVASDIMICNTTGSSQTFSLFFVGPSLAPVASNAIYYSFAIAANTVVHWVGNQTVSPGGSIYGSSSSTGVTFSITGSVST